MNEKAGRNAGFFVSNHFSYNNSVLVLPQR